MMTLLGVPTRSILVFMFFYFGFAHVRIFSLDDSSHPIEAPLLLVFVKVGIGDTTCNPMWWGFSTYCLSWTWMESNWREMKRILW